MGLIKILYRNGLCVSSAVAIGLLGCGGKAVLSPQKAKVDQRVIVTSSSPYQLTVKEFYDKLVASILMPQGGVLPNSEAREFLDSVVVDSLTGIEGDQTDLRSDFNRLQVFRAHYEGLLYYNFMQKQMEGVATDSAEVAAYYQEHIKDFDQPEQVEVSHIMTSWHGLLNLPDSAYYRTLPAEDRAVIAGHMIDSIYTKLTEGVPFDSAAVLYSHERNARRDKGYIGWTARGNYHAPFDSLAFALAPGEFSKPYRDSDGWHIIKVHAYRPAGPLPLHDSTVYSQIVQQLIAQRIRVRVTALLDSLSKDMQLTVNEPLYDSNLYDVDIRQWFAVVNEIDTIYVYAMMNAEEALKTRLRTANTTPEQKREVLRVLARHKCAVQYARRDGIDTLPEVELRRKDYHHDLAKSMLIEQWWDRSWMPSDSQIAAYYRDHPREFIVEKSLTVQHILLEDLAMAEFIRDQARAGVDFLELAQQYYPGDSALRLELADLGAIGPNDVDPAFFRTAQHLAPGDISEPVKTKYGFHVIKLIARNESKTFDDARTDIVNTLRQQRRMVEFRLFRDKLYRKYHVKIKNFPTSIFLEPIAYRRS